MTTSVIWAIYDPVWLATKSQGERFGPRSRLIHPALIDKHVALRLGRRRHGVIYPWIGLN